MRLLIDECLPRKLKGLLGGHDCRTVQEMGWSGRKNGELLSLAEGNFDVMVTADQGMEYEPRLADRKIAVPCSLLAPIRLRIWRRWFRPPLPLSTTSFLGVRFGSRSSRLPRRALSLLRRELPMAPGRRWARVT
ncbi:MAG TPA: DUF5615 family PIN-like protein [Candidatus Acidoferrales bacterium]|nr:DUF5615 family PIN-like protein [Candidatus Acidoferrales bacterium]